MDSVTAIPRQRFKDEPRDTPLLIVAGNAEQVPSPCQERLITFARVLWIGRRARKASSTVDDSGATWVAPDRLVSSKHASITAEGGPGGNWTLTDVGSTNGTIVDGVRAQPTRPLRDGSLIFAGSHALVFRLVAASQLAAIREELADPLGPVPTCNPEFAVTCSKLKKLADTDGEVLLTGETGVGKEVYAEAIHQAQRTARAVSWRSIAPPSRASLVESELFGYARGAHSQADRCQAGAYRGGRRRHPVPRRDRRDVEPSCRRSCCASPRTRC